MSDHERAGEHGHDLTTAATTSIPPITIRISRISKIPPCPAIS